MRSAVIRWVVVLPIIGLGACAPAAPRPGGNAGQAPAAGMPQATGPRTLTMAVRYEVPDLAPKRVAPSASQYTKRAFNAALALIDGKGARHPYVAEALPQLNTDSWRVFPDGRMETTYRLRPNLTWHDGTPFTAGGWYNADYDRWWTAFNTTLDRSQRNQQIVEMMKVATDQLPGIFLYFNIQPIAYAAALRGPEMDTPESLTNWNMHEFEMR
jgi:ABC-type transport system substrate-binding protein